VGGEGCGAERDGGALGEIRNEREEKPTHPRSKSEELLVALVREIGSAREV
jgi:hypothetical protein